jgi:bifunctional ADP-heptose synthase (sugar kinase/adenylyltransferase)
MLISAGLALISGATIWEAGAIGSVAAAIQVGRIGNLPLSYSELEKQL